MYAVTVSANKEFFPFNDIFENDLVTQLLLLLSLYHENNKISESKRNLNIRFSRSY